MKPASFQTEIYGFEAFLKGPDGHKLVFKIFFFMQLVKYDTNHYSLL